MFELDGVAHASRGPCSAPIGCFQPFTSSATMQSLAVRQGSRRVPPPPGSLSASTHISPSLHPYAFPHVHHLPLPLTPLAFVLTLCCFSSLGTIFSTPSLCFMSQTHNDCQVKCLPMCSCVWTLALQLVLLFWKAVEFSEGWGLDDGSGPLQSRS